MGNTENVKSKRNQNTNRSGDTVRRRKGYAYKYSPEDNEKEYYYTNQDYAFLQKESNDDTKETSSSNIDKTDTTSSNTPSSSIDSNVIDVEATVQKESPSSKEGKKSNDRERKQQSWEDRAQAYEQVPPKAVKAWGPDGVIDGGIDIRTYSARIALKEIEKARNIFEMKEELVNIAEEDLIQLKR